MQPVVLPSLEFTPEIPVKSLRVALTKQDCFDREHLFKCPAVAEVLVATALDRRSSLERRLVIWVKRASGGIRTRDLDITGHSISRK
ncbi:MAG TPA: hypothetical protein VFF30_13300 [Nitrososphaerales archaeon]|nr:hypothetical protein [Nitrososphaerales archaeon]